MGVLVQEIFDKMEVGDKLGMSPTTARQSVLPFTALHSFLSYPLQLTATIMSVNGSGMTTPNTIKYSGWTACLSSLCRTGNHKRGSNILFKRKAPFQPCSDG